MKRMDKEEHEVVEAMVIDWLVAKGIVFGNREGDAFKEISPDKIKKMLNR